jgi:pyrimidine-nucleoside phosphorylase
MDKRYQVFISSTYIDLQEERQEIMQALLELDCIPSGMELFPAANDDQWSLIKKVIDDCDYYIVVVGGRYGSLSSSGLSFTQMEYEYAVSQGKPVMGFLHKTPGSIPASKSEPTEEGRAKLEAFRKLVQQKMCNYWTTPADLGARVSRSLVKLIKTNPGVGWIRADLVPAQPEDRESKDSKRLRDIVVQKEGAESEELKRLKDLVEAQHRTIEELKALEENKGKKADPKNRPPDLIRKKRDGETLLPVEIASFVRGVRDGQWADYQAAAMLMAIYLKGMVDVERNALTQEMLHSGNILDLSDIPLPKADKHSTGGVGDKTSLIIAPLAAASGLCVPMISGRGLGHTGGTLDKLEAIPGYRVNLSLDEFRSLLRQDGFAMIGQTAEIAPADRKLYALRDATGTVESIPLIVASIMSKKLAAGLDILVLDVKTGSGAFMRDEARARELARALVATGNSCGVRTEALLTDMNQPLGQAVGHALETKECIELLRGEGNERARPVLDLSLELTARMVALSGLESGLDQSRARVRRELDSGAALEKFRLNIEAQGGDPRVCDEPGRLLDLKLRTVRVESPRAGYVAGTDAAEIGNTVAAMGGGRVRITDKIDPAVGFIAEAKIGDEVQAGDTIGLLYCRDSSQWARAAERIRAAYKIADTPPPALKLIKEVITI